MKKMLKNICPEWQPILSTIEDDTVKAFFDQDKTWDECYECIARSVTEDMLNEVDDLFIHNWDATKKDSYIQDVVYKGKVKYHHDWETYVEQVEKEAFCSYVQDLLLEEKDIRLYFCLRYCYTQVHIDLLPETKRCLKSFVVDPFFLAEKTFRKAYNRVYSFIYKGVKVFEGECISKAIQEILDCYNVQLYYSPTFDNKVATIYLKGGANDFIPLTSAYFKA